MTHSDVGILFQSMGLASDESVGAYMGIRGEEACCMYDRTRIERRHPLFERQWIHFVASVSLVETAQTTARTLSNH